MYESYLNESERIIPKLKKTLKTSIIISTKLNVVLKSDYFKYNDPVDFNDHMITQKVQYRQFHEKSIVFKSSYVL